MKITEILNVLSEKGSGKITFDALTDGSANEIVSTSLEHQKFQTTVQGSTSIIHGFISHTQSGQQIVVLLAETSNVQSDPVMRDL